MTRFTVNPSLFFDETATTEIYTLSLHDALPISRRSPSSTSWPRPPTWSRASSTAFRSPSSGGCPTPLSTRTTPARSEEHTSELQSRQYLVCRLLLAKNLTSRQPCTS